MKDNDFMNELEEFIFLDEVMKTEKGSCRGARTGGCLGMILMVIVLSTGFSAAFLSMLSAL